MQEKVTEKIEEVVTEDIWGAIKKFLDIGFHFGEEDHQVHITIGLLLLVIVSFVATSFILKKIRQLLTRRMGETDKLKFISVFKFIKYVVYVIVIFAVLFLSRKQIEDSAEAA